MVLTHIQHLWVVHDRDRKEYFQAIWEWMVGRQLLPACDRRSSALQRIDFSIFAIALFALASALLATAGAGIASATATIDFRGAAHGALRVGHCGFLFLALRALSKRLTRFVENITVLIDLKERWQARWGRDCKVCGSNPSASSNANKTHDILAHRQRSLVRTFRIAGRLYWHHEIDEDHDGACAGRARL